MITIGALASIHQKISLTIKGIVKAAQSAPNEIKTKKKRSGSIELLKVFRG